MTRAEQVHRELRAALLRGDFPYGQRLVEEQLAERFAPAGRRCARRCGGSRATGTSSATAPAACARTRRGCRPCASSTTCASCSRTWPCARRTRSALDGLLAEWLELRGEHDDSPDFVYADEAFHEGIARACGNTATERYLRDINERIRLIRIHDFTTPDRIEATIEEHLEILETVRAGRPDAAAALMRVHIERSAEVVERRVGELLARMFEEERP